MYLGNHILNYSFISLNLSFVNLLAILNQFQDSIYIQNIYQGIDFLISSKIFFLIFVIYSNIRINILIVWVISTNYSQKESD